MCIFCDLCLLERCWRGQESDFLSRPLQGWYRGVIGGQKSNIRDNCWPTRLAPPHQSVIESHNYVLTLFSYFSSLIYMLSHFCRLPTFSNSFLEKNLFWMTCCNSKLQSIFDAARCVSFKQCQWLWYISLLWQTIWSLPVKSVLIVSPQSLPFPFLMEIGSFWKGNLLNLTFPCLLTIDLRVASNIWILSPRVSSKQGEKCW